MSSSYRSTLEPVFNTRRKGSPLKSAGLLCNSFSPSLTFLLRKPLPGTMQSLDYQVFCQTCRELTYREVRYRSDYQFVGRLLVCQNCGETRTRTSRNRDGVPRL